MSNKMSDLKKNLNVTDEDFVIDALKAQVENSEIIVDHIKLIPKMGREIMTVNENLVKLANRIDITNERLVQLIKTTKDSAIDIIRVISFHKTESINAKKKLTSVPEGLPMIKTAPTPPIQPQPGQNVQFSSSLPNAGQPIISTGNHPTSIDKNKYYKIKGRISEIREKSLKVKKGETGDSFIFIAHKALKKENDLDKGYIDTLSVQTFIVQGWNMVSAIEKKYLTLEDLEMV